MRFKLSTSAALPKLGNHEPTPSHPSFYTLQDFNVSLNCFKAEVEMFPDKLSSILDERTTIFFRSCKKLFHQGR